MKYILYKGFVSIDGASLTVGEVFDDGFNIHLIPETLQVTNLGQRQQGDRLNIEVDQQTYSIVKTVERVLAQQGTVFD
jgi:riboflavin synthase